MIRSYTYAKGNNRVRVDVENFSPLQLFEMVWQRTRNPNNVEAVSIATFSDFLSKSRELIEALAAYSSVNIDTNKIISELSDKQGIIHTNGYILIVVGISSNSTRNSITFDEVQWSRVFNDLVNDFTVTSF